MRDKLSKLNDFLKRAEPWGVALTVIGLIFATWQFSIERQDREEDRINRAISQFDDGIGRIDALSVLLRNAVDLDYLKAGGAYLPNASFDGLTLKGVDFSHSRMPAASFRGAKLVGVNFTGADLSGVDFSGATLLNVKLLDADLSFSSFMNAKMLFDSIDHMHPVAGIDGANFTGLIDGNSEAIPTPNGFNSIFGVGVNSKIRDVVMPDGTSCSQNAWTDRSDCSFWYSFR